MINFTATKRFIISKLRRELSHKFYYHVPEHSIDVCDACVRLAKMEKVDDKDIVMLKTAALFHDSGFVVKYRDHETESMNIARENLPAFGYNQAEIDLICSLINATRLPQVASTKLEKIICDADFDYLGRTDFFMIAHQLRYEWEEVGYLHSTLKEWYQLQVDFLEGHSYFTDSAKILRHNGKIKNLLEIKDLHLKNKKKA